MDKKLRIYLYTGILFSGGKQRKRGCKLKSEGRSGIDQQHLKKPCDGVFRQVIFLNPQGKGKQERPKSKWKSSAEQEQWQIGLRRNEMELQAQDWDEWGGRSVGDRRRSEFF